MKCPSLQIHYHTHGLDLLPLPPNRVYSVLVRYWKAYQLFLKISADSQFELHYTFIFLDAFFALGVKVYVRLRLFIKVIIATRPTRQTHGKEREYILRLY